MPQPMAVNGLGRALQRAFGPRLTRKVRWPRFETAAALFARGSQRLLDRPSLLLRSPRDEGVEDVGHGYDMDRLGDGRSDQLVWVAAAVPALATPRDLGSQQLARTGRAGPTLKLALPRSGSNCPWSAIPSTRARQGPPLPVMPIAEAIQPLVIGQPQSGATFVQTPVR